MKILSNYELNKNNIAFIKLCTNLMNKYPFKWFYFMEIFKKDVIYIKDTTIIIELLKLNYDEINNIFIYFKEFLNNKIITKLIYKKEYLVVIFDDLFNISFFLKNNKWMLILLMNYCINNNIKSYYDVYLKSDETIYSMFMIKCNNYFITFDNIKLNKLNNNHIPLVINLYNNNDFNIMFSFDIDILLNNIKLKLPE